MVFKFYKKSIHTPDPILPRSLVPTFLVLGP